MAEIKLNDGRDDILIRNYEFGWEMCWSRNRNIKQPDGSVVSEAFWSPGKWYANLPQLLNVLAEMKLRNSDATTLQELLTELEKIRTELLEVYSARI